MSLFGGTRSALPPLAGDYGICHLSSVALRASASHKAEQTSTLLFGEHFIILELSESWVRISVFHDGYEGWLEHQQFLRLPVDTARGIERGGFAFAGSMDEEVVVPVSSGTDFGVIRVYPGAVLPDFSTGRFMFGEVSMTYSGAVFRNQSHTFDSIVPVISQFLNAPYYWGGRTPAGVDCSGLVQVLMRLLGVSLPRDASQQVSKGEPVSFLEESLPGDLAFFDNADGHIVHVGILLGAHEILHSSGRVHTSFIDHEGIYSSSQARYTHHLRTIRRVLPVVL